MLRYKGQKPIGLDEFLYPLMQGYDSVALNCDVEFGGTDQTFNLLAGRKLMPVFGQKPQSAVVMKLLTGSDGRPMGKSLMNFIPISEDSNNMYAKIMSIVDEIVFEYFELLTRVPMAQIDDMKQAVSQGENPMKFKKILAKDITTFYHGAKAAEAAAVHFEKTVQNKELDETDLIKVDITGETTLLDAIFNASDQTLSKGQIKRTIEQGGVTHNSIKITDPFKVLELKSGDVIKFGKRVFYKIR
jgi:tyrosyl-tRNA synthetase